MATAIHYSVREKGLNVPFLNQNNNTRIRIGKPIFILACNFYCFVLVDFVKQFLRRV